MKTTFTKTAILLAIMTSVFTNTNVQAKMSDKIISSDNLAIADFNIEHEINSNLQQMLSAIDAETLKYQINKQLSEQTLELQTNQMVKDADEQFPAFKFKVIIAD